MAWAARPSVAGPGSRIGHNGGAPRVIHSSRIEHVCGNPGLTPDMNRDYGRLIVETALTAIRTAVTGPTLFEPGASASAVDGGVS